MAQKLNYQNQENVFNLNTEIMKTKLLTLSAFALLSITSLVAQDKTTVRATSADISDNLDLRAIATVFGDASNLEDFENRINDPKAQISNLDLNNDNYVDYLRVIESVEGNAHLVVVQAVLDKDIYQDVATIEVQRDRNNKVQVQVVGDVYMYGENYIYEPVYVHTPVIYTTFWATNYRPYYSSWYWNYYPSYYTYWAPYPVYRYRNNVHVHINFGHSYHYVTNRRCQVAYASYYGRRGNGYETRYPDRSFSHRNAGYTNRQDLDNNRRVNSPRGRNEMNPNEARTRGTAGRATAPVATERENRATNASPSTRETTGTRATTATSGTRETSGTRATTATPRTRNTEVTTAPRAQTSATKQRETSVQTRSNTATNAPRTATTRPASQQRASAPRAENQRSSSQSSPKMSAPRSDSGQRNSAPRSNSESRSSSSRSSGRG